MTGNLVSDSPWLLLKISGQGAVSLQPHQILADIERPFRYAPHRIAPDDLRIFPFPHQAAPGHRRDNIIALLHPGQKRRNIRRGSLLNRRRMADVEPGHAATALFGNHDMHSVFFENLDCRFADIGRLIIDRAAPKERNLPRRGSGNLRGPAALPPMEKRLRRKSQDMPISMDADPRFYQPAKKSEAQGPVRYRREHTAEGTDRIRLDQPPIAPAHAPRRGPMLLPRDHPAGNSA